MQSLVDIGPVVFEKKIFKFRQYIFLLFRNYLPLEKIERHQNHLSKLESPLPKDSLC